MEMKAYHPFRSVAAKEQYLEIYEKRAKTWPVDSQTRLVDTSYGQTFVRVSGPVGAALADKVDHAGSSYLCASSFLHQELHVLAAGGFSTKR